MNGVTLNVPGALAGDANTAALLDGSNDLISMGDPADGVFDNGTGDFSAEAWIKTSLNGERTIIGKRPSSGVYWQVTITDDSGHAGQLRASIFDGTVTRTAYSTVAVDDGAWHHIVVLFDRDAGLRFYVDGGAAGFTSGQMAGDVSNSASLQVGKVTAYGYLNGVVDEVAVYNSLLTAARIQAHFASGSGP
jgi:hypothetical protein